MEDVRFRYGGHKNEIAEKELSFFIKSFGVRLSKKSNRIIFLFVYTVCILKICYLCAVFSVKTMKNKVTATFIFALLVVGGLLAMYWLPVWKVDGYTLRKVDLLSDLRPDPVEEELSDSDSLALPPVVKPVFIDTCKTGMTCIEDYADSTMRGMSHFYEALAECSTLDRPVRIAYFGDSFIEGDILTADLRALLQSRFGGCGVGYVPITSRVAGFRPTVRHTFSGWQTHAVTDSAGFKRRLQDLSNHYYIPSPGAGVTLKGLGTYADHLASCEASSLYFVSSDSIWLTARINQSEEPVSLVFGGDSLLQVATVRGNISNVEWKVEKTDSTAICYGVTMDPSAGIVVDNFSTRGSSGEQLGGIPMAMLRAYNRLRTYDLIVLQYGLNVASEGITNYRYYTSDMVHVINRLKAAFPQASILLVSIGDRESKSETGELRTMPGVKSLVRYQQALAAETHIAFWNLFEAMGGEGSMVRMVESKPQQANYDYTHINFRGGKHLAKLLFETLTYGQEQYEKRKAYENN